MAVFEHDNLVGQRKRGSNCLCDSKVARLYETDERTDERQTSMIWPRKFYDLYELCATNA